MARSAIDIKAQLISAVVAYGATRSDLGVSLAVDGPDNFQRMRLTRENNEALDLVADLITKLNLKEA